MLNLVLIYLCGIFVGFMVARMCVSGTLKIDKSDPEQDRYLLEIDQLEGLDRKKRIVLKVDSHADLSQK